MDFQDRYEAGRLLAQVLKKYKGLKVVVFALPRGGVVTASEIAKELDAPLDLILAHKIGHPHHPEYAIAAISEGGYVIENPLEIQQIDSAWYTREKEQQMSEIRKKREKYIKGRKEISIKDTIAILVDDGIATGLTMKAAVLELQSRKPKKIVIAVPVAPKSTTKALEEMVDEFVSLNIPSDFAFRGAVGSYYKDFTQTDDNEVLCLLEENKKREQERENVR